MVTPACPRQNLPPPRACSLFGTATICLLAAAPTLAADRLTDRAFATRSEVIAPHAMAATSQPLVTQIALDVMKAGGSAVDAAIAADAALGLMEPTGSGMGGDLFAIVWDPKTNKLYGYNGSGRSPKSLTLAEFEKRGLKDIPPLGPLPVSVPGCVDALDEALQKGIDTILHPTAEQKAAQIASRQYMQALLHSLRTSTDARDRALASQLADGSIAEDELAAFNRDQRGILIRNAAEAAPDDALVQWLWASGLWTSVNAGKEANDEESGCTARNQCPQRAKALVRLQPDNGWAWLPVFNAAWNAKDMPAAEFALAQMAQATHFDEQYVEALKAWMNVFQRYPMPPAALSPDDPPIDTDARNSLMAINTIGSMPMLPFASLINACSHDKHPEASVRRFRACSQTGRVMLNRSTSLGDRMIGRALLRASGQATSADITAARILMWQQEQVMDLSFNSKFVGLVEFVTDAKKHYADLIATGDEAQVMQHELQRAGIPLTPPSDWQLRSRGRLISPLGEPQQSSANPSAH